MLKTNTLAKQRRQFLQLGFSLPGLIVLAEPVHAQTAVPLRGGLYDPEPPADSSYVRIVVVGSDSAVDIYVDEKPHATNLAAGEVGDYMILAGGKKTIQIHAAGKSKASVSHALDVPKGKAITLAFNGIKSGTVPTQFEDKANTNKLKAVVAAYHLDTKVGALDVLTADGVTKVFTNLTYGTSNSIQVNPISVELIAAKTGTTASALANKSAGLTMTQGATYSVFFVPDAQGKLVARTFQNKTERYAAKS